MKRSVLVFVTALCALFCGCASQGPLRPPSLNLPAAVRHLDAARIGNSVDLSWTNPAKTSDGVSLTARHGAGALVAQLCRSESALSPTCTPFATLHVVSGMPATFHDVLPTQIASGAIRALRYQVRVVNAQGKGAKWTEATTAAGIPPQPLQSLQAYPVSNGIVLRWKPGEGGGVMFRVSRGTDTAHTTLLRVSDPASGSGPPSSDPAGTLDTGGRAGQQQRYIGFRQSTVQLGGTSVVLQSDPVRIEVSATAKLPLPAAPTNLEAVVNTLDKPEIDLVWQPPDDASVTGYRIYRRQDEDPAVLLTPSAMPGFTYTDKTVQPGHRYRYTVVAVNATGESAAAVTAAVLP